MSSCEFWDVLAPHHAAVENSYLNLSSLRRILSSIEAPVLVVGAGQGLIVAELQKKGFQCDGVDLSPEMIRYAKARRGLTLVKADASAMPFADESYATVLYATGVLDFILEEQTIRAILTEGRRVLKSGGKIFIAFYRFSPASERFLQRVGLLSHSVVSFRKSMEMYRLNPVQMVGWVAERVGVGYGRATAMMLRLSMLSTLQEKAMTFRMQAMCRDPQVATALRSSTPERAPYRNEPEIRNLLDRLSIPIRQLLVAGSCFIVEI